jgi:hypothetical protein
VQHSIEIAAPPSRQELESNVEDRRDGSDCPQREGVEVTALDPRDRCARHLRGHGDILLPQLALDPSRPKRGAYTLVIHRAR